MFLPQGEFHELGLLYVQYLLKIRDIRILYLGADVPMEELEFVVKLKKPGYIFTHLTSVNGKFNFEKFLEIIGTRLGNTTLVASGRDGPGLLQKASF